jgi:hypothetical protein
MILQLGGNAKITNAAGYKTSPLAFSQQCLFSVAPYPQGFSLVTTFALTEIVCAQAGAARADTTFGDLYSEP